MKHLTKIDAQQYVNKETGVFKTSVMKRHIEKCRECKDLIKKGEEDKRLLEEVRDAVKDTFDPEAGHLEKDTLLKIRNRLAHSESN